ncbi:MAG: M20/M25/M40 family metallo-hydrolase [Gemmatimonadetes bacterium]|uniref:M20/M25/M40 family metallo-hydrolase n=1 Tax=Candidatus Kutchimonas denitrificans TaxID=3056748 RepID=A0AAE4Z9K2_9BACT|nr:M20/M25/M40 family metallo-hydrolase [Gemmatimonadota bacterium]NIR75568.1 M20/M25/M40 family metallo-hydrolase [Candidatus Kutchimonas denitrificans]NIS01882.1 M20/M25/M40 family metallo-hydrolase [Gemmatimonadota bacterium]NIT67663.1 M20/M25/M40 family metallo-hydrolase [Gemmatimonadota bacterium]NIU53537.1 M20/M25/M40 family metallo-hydrolase [Gemmatimonadota bacterium]
MIETSKVKLSSRAAGGAAFLKRESYMLEARSCIVVAVAATALASGCRSAPGYTDRDVDITEADMRARIGFLAADQLEGRGTPSTGLELAASYIRSEFARMGLQAPPGGYVQRYRLAMTEMGADWSLALSRGNRRALLALGTDYWGLPWAAGTVEGDLRFVDAVGRPGMRETGEPTIWVARLSAAVLPREWLAEAADAGAAGLLLVLTAETEALMSHWLEVGETLYELGDVEPSLPAALVTESALAAALERLGLEATTTAGAPAGSGVRARLAADLRAETLAAPNVMGIVRGSDPELAEEFVLLSAHMDGLGVGPPVDGDSIYNGADDNASGTSALLEVAEAVAALERRPKRSIFFLAVSGEERGLLGSSWFVEHPPIRLDRVIANINIDMVGRNWEDTIAVIGKPYSTLGAIVDSVAAAHPELSMTPVGDRWPQENFFFRSDHFNFAREGIPAVFFFNGVHEDYHMPSDEADKIKNGKAARVSRLIFEVAVALANAEQPPGWDDAARARIVEDGR